MPTVTPDALTRAHRRSRADDSWQAFAACSGIDVRIFYPDSSRRADEAKALCAVCPVRAACLEYALDAGEAWGVWGGTTEDERRVIRQQRRTAS